MSHAEWTDVRVNLDPMRAYLRAEPPSCFVTYPSEPRSRRRGLRFSRHLPLAADATELLRCLLPSQTDFGFGPV